LKEDDDDDDDDKLQTLTRHVHYPECKQALGSTRPPIQWVPEERRAALLGINQQEREADFSPQLSLGFKDVLSTSL
jgi:hypothetical protein